MNKVFWPGLLLALLPVVLPAGEIRYYDVEIVLFENLDRAAREAEQWPASVELEQEENTAVLGERFTGTLPEGVDPRNAFRLLPAKRLQLNDQARKIEESPSRRVLLHTAWRQPGLSRENAINVYFRKAIPAIPAEPAEATATAADPGTATAPPPSRYVDPEAGEIEGLIKVILSRYLHVTTDIVFRPQPATPPADPFFAGQGEFGADREPIEPETATGFEALPQPVVYRQHQTRRRMRSRELHYLDNPVLGLLVLITPYEAPPAADKAGAKNQGK